MSSRVLVVDDDVDTLNILALTLQMAGYDVLKANSGRQALDLLSSAAVDAIILDIMMPDISGYDVMRHLKVRAERQPPVIFLSAKGLIEDRVEGLEMGAFRYLVKPISKDRLLNAVSEAVKSRTQL